MGAKLIIHGHHHEDYRARNGFGVEVFGIGLKQVLPFDKRMINQVLSE
jgi:calcineurin-like phosphoesterase family protein